MIKRLLVATAAFAFSAAAAHAANLVTDGDFASPSGGASYTTYNSGSNFGPWDVTGGSVDLIGGYWQAPTAGGGSVDLDGNTPGTISQTLDLAAGAYTLSFFISGNPDGPPPTKAVEVSVGSLSSDPFTYATGTNSRSNMEYALETVNFTSNGSPTKLVFASGDSDTPYGAAIGGVNISAAPEPAAWALMILGIGAIGGALQLARRRQDGVAFAAS